LLSAASMAGLFAGSATAAATQLQRRIGAVADVSWSIATAEDHLVVGPALLFHPALFLSAARSALFGGAQASPRPEVLSALNPAHARAS
jgi:hypothetical protein